MRVMSRSWLSRSSSGIAAAMLLCIAARARAQSAAGLAGQVTGPSGEPVASALVRLSTLDGADFRATRTGADGRYRVAFPSSGARFSLWVERLGYAPATAVVDRGDGGPVVRDVRLAARPAQLAGIAAVTTRTTVPRSQTGPGGRSNAGHGDGSERYPLEPGDLGAFAENTRGAVPVGGEGAEAVSIGGMAPSQNRTVMDGASSSAASLPAEAVRAVGVLTNGYDVSRGQFTGGQLAVATMGGTNFSGGAFSVRWRTPPLSWGSRASTAAGWESGVAQVSGGYGGALRRDRLFAFGAFQASRRSAPFASLADADAATLRRLGLSGDSVRRFADVLGRVGAPVGSSPAGANSEAASALLRLDWKPSQTHSFVARLDGRGSRADGAGSALGWLGTGGRRSGMDGGALLAWTAHWAGDAQQELHAYATTGRWRTRPYLEGPAGRVRVASAEDGDATLEFGGDPYLSSTRRRSLVEISDDVQLPLAGGSQQLRFGAVYALEQASLAGTSDAMGTFVFNSLDDLEAGIPSAFTRTLSSREREAAARYLGVYVGHRVQAGRALSLGYGLRADAGSYPTAAEAGGAAPALGYRPGRVPAYASVSPRFGFTWELGKTASLMGGVGRFVGRVPLSSLVGAVAEDGSEASRLVCVGPAAPAPDWDAYGRDPDAVPGRCADGAAPFAQQAPAVTAFAPGYAPPHAWRGSLELGWNPAERWFVNVQASAARGGGVPLAFDRNLARVPRFELAAEGMRPVYVPAEAVDPASGAAAPAASRLDPAYSTVREVAADGRSGAAQVTLSLSRAWPGSRMLGAWYTWTRAWDEAAGAAAPGGSSAGTSGDPWAVERAPADYARRHALFVRFAGGVGRGVSVGLIGRLLSGLPYTPWVDGDVNGDGAANDRAYVFGPAATPEVSAAMARLLDEAPAGAQACLRRQQDRVARRNGCTGPWEARLDAQATLTPGQRPNRVRLTLVATNLAGAADYLLHGAGGLRGWGQPRFPDPTLLYVRGFDPAARTFRYEVNPRFGRGIGALAAPFTLTLQARVRVGADPARQWITESLRASARYRRSPTEIAAALAQRIPNYPAQVLRSADSAGIQLTALQRETLRRQADSTQVEIDALIGLLAPLVSATDTSMRVASSPPVRDLTARVRTVAEASVDAVRAVLTPEQLGRLPAGLLAPLGLTPIVPPKSIVMEMPDP
jgi:hypothetical protein